MHMNDNTCGMSQKEAWRSEGRRPLPYTTATLPISVTTKSHTQVLIFAVIACNLLLIASSRLREGVQHHLRV